MRLVPALLSMDLGGADPSYIFEVMKLEPSPRLDDCKISSNSRRIVYRPAVHDVEEELRCPAVGQSIRLDSDR